MKRSGVKEKEEEKGRGRRRKDASYSTDRTNRFSFFFFLLARVSTFWESFHQASCAHGRQATPR